MVQIPILVQDAPIVRMQNAVLVDFCKFTKDQFNAHFTGENPAPTKIAEQMASFAAAYDTLNQAYAVTLRSSITDEIAAQMFRSFDTVKFYRRQIFEKLDVKNITEALALATNYGLL